MSRTTLHCNTTNRGGIATDNQANSTYDVLWQDGNGELQSTAIHCPPNISAKAKLAGMGIDYDDAIVERRKR